MYYRSFPLLLVFCCFHLLHAQRFEWVDRIGGIGVDLGNSIAVDLAGNVYTLGTFQDTVDFDPDAVGVYELASYALGLNNLFVSKVNAAGQFEWARDFNIHGFNSTMVADAAGNVYVTGIFDGTVDFDPDSIGVFNVTSQGANDPCVFKLNAAGNLVWAKHLGGYLHDGAYSIGVDAVGNVYTVGYFRGIADFDPGSGQVILTSFGNSDAFVSKLDSNGNFVWAKQFGGPDFENGLRLAVAPNGALAIAGGFEGTSDFDPDPSNNFTLTSTGSVDYFVVKLDSIGLFEWAIRLGGPGYEDQMALAMDGSENVVFSGLFTDTLDVDPDPFVTHNVISSNTTSFVAQYGGGGQLLWAKQFEGIGMGVVITIVHDTADQLYMGGLYYNTCDFDPDTAGYALLTSAGYSDAFITHWDADGDFQWGRRIGGRHFDGLNGLAVSLAGELYATGNFEDTVDFNPGPTMHNLISGGDDDLFILKMETCNPTASSTQSITSCGSYHWPFNSQNYTATGTYAHHVMTQMGCDSIIEMELTVLPPLLVSITVQADTLIAAPIGNSYLWLDCDNGNQAIPGATASTYVPIGGGNYAVIVTNNSCSDTSACVSFGVGSADARTHDVSLFPNPTHEKVNITSSSPISEVLLYDLSGKRLVGINGHNTFSLDFDLGQYPQGMYIVKILLADQKHSVVTRKVVRNE